MRRNVVFITIDAWRADFVDTFDGVPLVPALDAVADRTVRFDACYTNGPWTSPGVISQLTGLSPFRHGVQYAWSAPPTPNHAVARVLGEAGWHTPNLCYLNDVGNYADLGWDPLTTPARPKHPFEDSLVKAIQTTSEPYFLWFHFKWVHLPYWAEPRYRDLFGIDEAALCERVRRSVASEFVVPRQRFQLDPSDRDDVRKLYAAVVRQMNDWLEPVLAAACDGPAGRRTSVVLSADHGEELLDHDHVGHASTSHHATLNEEVLRIPLLVVDPRVATGARIPTRVQGVDLHRTLLGLAGHGTDVPGNGLDLTGVILDAPGAREALAAHGDRVFTFESSRRGYQTPEAEVGQLVSALSDGHFKYIEERFDSDRAWGFDLDADPEELRPITDPDTLAPWAARFAEERHR